MANNSSNSNSNWRKTLLAALVVLSGVSAQTTSSDSFSFLPSSASSTFPECGLSCTALTEAQSACVPPQAAVTNDETYISCFCQSSYLTSLTSSGTVCTSCTSYSDQELLVNWYNGYCAGGYTSTLTATATTTSSSTSSTNTAPTTTTAGATTGTSTVTASSKSSGPPSWFSSHWRWVVMLIVLAVAFAALGVLGTWWKRRHDAKRPGLYHGNNPRNSVNMTAAGRPGAEGAAAAGFFAGSLRNLSKSNPNSTNNPSANSSNNNVAAGSKYATAAVAPSGTSARSQRQPSMSMVRSSILSTKTNDTNNNYNNNNTSMWGPHQATAHTRDFDDITPVDGTAFRNQMAAAAAAAALDKTGTMTSTYSGSRTEVSSIATGGGAGAGVPRATTPRSNNNSNRLSKLSVQSSSTLQRQTSSNTLQRGPPSRTNANASDLSPVSPINDEE